MLYVLTYPRFAPDVAAALDRFRAQHEPDRAQLVPPHITLVFGTDPAHASDVIAAAETVAAHTAPFDMSFSHTAPAFDPVEQMHKLFLICEAGRSTLTALHRRLYDGPHRADLRPDLSYRPHMTIATNGQRSEIEHLTADTIGAFPIMATAASLVVVRHAQSDLKVLRDLPFGG